MRNTVPKASAAFHPSARQSDQVYHTTILSSLILQLFSETQFFLTKHSFFFYREILEDEKMTT